MSLSPPSRTIRRALLIALCGAMVAAACWHRYASTNDDRAYVTRDGQLYRVTLTGWRFPLVHDPLSILVERTRQETLTLELPRIDGVIQGTEIPVEEGRLRYVGQVRIADGKMTVELFYADSDGRRPTPWNDEYTLVHRDTVAPR